jgi:hypothetical protein
VKKLIGVGMLGVGIVAMATGCVSDPYINYEGEKMRQSEVEEIIADKLEVENNNLDLEVDIYQEED